MIYVVLVGAYQDKSASLHRLKINNKNSLKCEDITMKNKNYFRIPITYYHYTTNSTLLLLLLLLLILKCCYY